MPTCWWNITGRNHTELPIESYHGRQYICFHLTVLFSCPIPSLWPCLVATDDTDQGQLFTSRCRTCAGCHPDYGARAAVTRPRTILKRVYVWLCTHGSGLVMRGTGKINNQTPCRWYMPSLISPSQDLLQGNPITDLLIMRGIIFSSYH